MTIEKLLEELYEEAMDELFQCSGNYKMTLPKRGMQERFEKYKERSEILYSLLQGAKESRPEGRRS